MTTYKEAGVDVAKKMRLTEKIKAHVASTFTKDSVTSGTLFKFGGGVSVASLKEMDEPVLVSSVDGVGTKLMIARMLGTWDSVGEDIVNHCANDVFTSGARPLFFLDYVAAEHLEDEVIEQIVAGVARACKKLGVVLAGGETAEMPGTYSVGEHDLAGTMVGAVERRKMITGEHIAQGDVLIGLSSSGLHTNGYTLARKALFEMGGFKPDDYVAELGRSVGEALLEPHREYVSVLSPLADEGLLKGIAHITGGGITDNLPRIFAKGLGAEIERAKVPVLPLFRIIQQKGDVPEDDMWRTFNMGAGVILVVSVHDKARVMQQLKAHNPFVCGTVVGGEGVTYV